MRCRVCKFDACCEINVEVGEGILMHNIVWSKSFAKHDKLY